MKKFIWLLYSMPVAIFATETRINTLGGVPYFIDDDANIKIYPAQITEYSNRIIGEITQPAMNIIAGLKIMTLGVGINSDTIPAIVNRVIDKAPFKRFTPSPMISLYLGKTIKNSAIGIKICESHNYYEKDKFLQSIQLQDITIGSKISLEDFLIDFFIGRKEFAFESKGKTATGDTFYFNNKNNPSLETGIRFSPIFSPKVNIILGINYKKLDVSYEDQNNKNNFTQEATQGYGVIKLIPNKNFTFIFGMLVEKEKCDTLIETTKETFPKIVIATESNLTEWLKIRISSNKSYWTFKKAEEEKTIDSEYNLAIGWAVDYKNFELDIMGNDLPLAKQSLGISLSYKFNSLF